MLMAEAATFFSAGFETSSTAKFFAMYEIAKNVDIQEKLRNEIKKMLVSTDGKVTYDAVINEMPYLQQVVQETLRVYALLAILD